MSKIAFTPNASGTGTLTIAAPNTDTDRTLTLPDATGTVVYANASGNVGLGTSSPTPLGTGITTLELKGNSASQTDRAGGINFMRYDGNPGMYVYHADDASYISSLSTYPLLIQTNGTERARIDSDGNLLVGTTSANGNLTVQGTEAASYTIYSTAHPTLGYNIACRGVSTTGVAVRFLNASGTDVGSIDYTSTATSYTTSSDYRLKENVQPMQDALAKIAQLNPVTYTWKADGSDGQGFIAHELQAVVPDCVSGEKDAVDAEGNPQYQGVDTSFLVATLVKAVQELTARIAALEAN